MTKLSRVLFLFADGSVKKQKADPEVLQTLLNDASAELGKKIEFYVSYARSLSYFISNDKVRIRDHLNHMNLEDYDFVYFRKAGSVMQQMLVCALYLQDRNIPFFDAEIAATTSRNKLSQMYMLQRRGIPIPTTLFCRNNRRLMRLVASKYTSDIGWPIIAKATGGTRGDANYLIKSEEELGDIISHQKRHFLIQNFIPNDGDFRYFVAGGELVGVIERKSSGVSHLNNTSQGGSAEMVNLGKVDSNLRSDALLAARIFKRDVAGVDVIVNKETGKHFILEVNRSPQIEHASFEPEKAVWMVQAIEKAMTDFQISSNNDKSIFGRFETVYLTTRGQSYKIIAKVDTGADSSSLHATDIIVKDNQLVCKIGDHKTTFETFFEKQVKSSNGHLQRRYLVNIIVKIGGSNYDMKVTLTDRSDMKYDMLIGRRFLRANNLLVDVSRRFIASGKKVK